MILAAIVGAPWQLTSRNGDAADGSHIGSELDASDWRELVGDPPSYTPADDAHMIESIEPRPGLPGAGSPTDDPIHGHEFSIPQRDDLQYACIFPLVTPRDCTLLETCDCYDALNDNPICQGTLQVAAKSYPGIRELDLVRALEHRGVLGSICPAQQADPGQPDYGYRPTFETLLELAEERLE